MLKGRKFFISGLILATFVSACFFSISSIEASGKAIQNDILFAKHLGIFDSSDYSPKLLNKPITELAFYRGLTRILIDLGFVRVFDFNEMKRIGILNFDEPQKVITRKNAVETIFRAIIFAVNTNKIEATEKAQTFQPFYDWIIEEKYMKGLSVALEAGIIKGMPNGRFSPATYLKTSDALVLFRRIHQAFVKHEAPKEAIYITKEDRQTVSLESLNKSGAFDLTDINLRLDGKNEISLEDLSKMVQGILTKKNKPAFVTEMKYFIRKMNPNRSVTRKTLAFLASTLVRALPRDEVDSYNLYADVKPGTGLARALAFLSRAGIKMGYANNTLKPNEKVGRYEVLRLFNEILSNSREIKVEAVNSGTNSATKEDFEAFKNLIEVRKARIHRILNRN